MSHAISVSAGKPFGLQRICQVLEFPRSTIYAVRARATTNVTPMVPRRRGPKPKMPDADLLRAIRDDLAASPFSGEGHRKVWARLRIVCDIRVSRTHVLRLMREHGLLSPHRFSLASAICTTTTSSRIAPVPRIKPYELSQLGFSPCVPPLVFLERSC